PFHVTGVQTCALPISARPHRHAAGDPDEATGARRRRRGRMSRQYFGTDGIRGRVGEGPISADFVLRLGNAYGHALRAARGEGTWRKPVDRKSTRLNSSHVKISYAVFCL